MDQFPQEIHDRLGWYVYRLIDPRNGNTFYVGKGRGNRLFQHARGEAAEIIEPNETGLVDTRLDVIRAIRRAGLSVLHVVHRHGIEDEQTAYQIEAAVIDAFPGLKNIVGGHGSNIQGCRSVEEIVSAYRLDPLVVKEPLILIYVSKALDEGRDVYNAVRAAWRMSKERAETHGNLVLAYDGVKVIGAYRPNRWIEATKADFNFLSEDNIGRIGFEGKPADDVEKIYLEKRVPPRKKGSRTAFRYLTVNSDPEGDDS